MLLAEIEQTTACKVVMCPTTRPKPICRTNVHKKTFIILWATQTIFHRISYRLVHSIPSTLKTTNNFQWNTLRLTYWSDLFNIFQSQSLVVCKHSTLSRKYTIISIGIGLSERWPSANFWEMTISQNLNRRNSMTLHMVKIVMCCRESPWEDCGGIKVVMIWCWWWKQHLSLPPFTL